MNTGQSDYTLTSDKSSMETFGFRTGCRLRCDSPSDLQSQLTYYVSGTASYTSSTNVFSTTPAQTSDQSYPSTIATDVSNAATPTITWTYSNIASSQMSSDYGLPTKADSFYYKCFADFNTSSSQNNLRLSDVGTSLSIVASSIKDANLGGTVATTSSPSSGTTTSAQPTEKEKELRITATVMTIVFLGLVALISIICFVLKKTPLTPLWLFIDQVQIIILLMLMDTHTPLEFEKFLDGVGFIMANFNFIWIPHIPLIKEFTDWLDYGSVPEKMDNVGIESKSFLYNNFSLVIIFSVIGLIHLILKVSVCSRNGEHENSWIQKISKIRHKMKEVLFYSVYMRLLLLAFSTIIFSALLDIREFEFSKASRILSHLSAWMILLAAGGFIGLLFFLSYSGRVDFSADQKTVWREVFSGLKDTKISRTLLPLSMIRKISIAVIIVVLSMEGERAAAFSLLITIQVIYLALVALLRPFELFQNNLIAILQELHLLGEMTFLLIMNEGSDWSATGRGWFMGTLILNSLIAFTVMACDISVSLVRGAIKKPYAGDEKSSQQINPEQIEYPVTTNPLDKSGSKKVPQSPPLTLERV